MNKRQASAYWTALISIEDAIDKAGESSHGEADDETHSEFFRKLEAAVQEAKKRATESLQETPTPMKVWPEPDGTYEVVVVDEPTVQAEKPTE